jgi:electron transport complex protein RnfB
VADAFGITVAMQKKSQWEKPQIDLKVCMLCGICIDACPVNCLGLIALSGGLLEKVGMVQEKRCIGCGFCRRECPVDAITMTGPSS